MAENNPPATETAMFANLVLGLAAAALTYLGRDVMPGTEKKEVNLPLARQTIDTIEMLQKKTEGNRTAEETGMLEGLLHDLRIAYLKAESAPPADKPAEPPEQTKS